MNIGGGYSLERDRVEPWAYADKIFNEEECKKIILQNNYLQKAVISKNNVLDESTRKSHVNFIYPSNENIWIFERLAAAVIQLNKQFFNFDLFGFIEGLQFTKYEAPHDFYGAHIDKIYNRVIRKLSISIQLSDPQEYEGGDLLLYFSKKPTETPKGIGKIIIFPSYTLHEVTPVTKGTRYSLVAWITGNQFK